MIVHVKAKIGGGEIPLAFWSLLCVSVARARFFCVLLSLCIILSVFSVARLNYLPQQAAIMNNQRHSFTSNIEQPFFLTEKDYITRIKQFEKANEQWN